MNIVDGVLWGLMLLSAAMGFWRGVVKEFFSLVSWVLSFVLCSKYAAELSQTLPWPDTQPAIRVALAWGLIFLLVMLVMALIGSVLKRLLSLAGLGLADRLLGMLFGVARGSIMWMAMVVMVGLTPLRHSHAWVNSQVAQSAHQLLMYLRPVLPAPLERLVT